MFANYLELAPWLGIILGGVAGCTVLGLIAMTRGAAFSAVAGNPGKQLWSVIYSIPVPFLLHLGGTVGLGLLLAFIWLVVSPIVGLKTVFKPAVKLRMTQLVIAHVIFAAVVLIVFMLAVYFIA